MPGKVGSKEKLRQFLLANIGRVIESRELQAAADGAVQYDRRVRELREDEKWPILTHNDTTDLRPGQYLLREQPPEKSAVRFTRGISAKLRALVYDRNGFTRIFSISTSRPIGSRAFNPTCFASFKSTTKL